MRSGQSENKALNEKEYAARKDILQSGPSNIILCSTYKCNMSCIFCLGRGQDPDFNCDIYKTIFENKLRRFLENATDICFTGWGEFLLWPGAADFLGYLNEHFPEANKILTTNGTPLSEAMASKMIIGNYTVQVSLHTSDALIHRSLTQSDFFEQIVINLDNLILLRNENSCHSRLWIVLMFLVTSLNIENLPDFVDFAGLRGANEVFCNYITIFLPEQIGLSCFFSPQNTNRIFDEAQKRAQRYSMRLNLPPRFGLTGGMQRESVCQAPWNTVFIDGLGNIHPCCFSGRPIGNINMDDFGAIWNGENYRELRSCLAENRPHERCKDCYKFSSVNVNDIKSHITFRDIRAKEDIFKRLNLEA